MYSLSITPIALPHHKRSDGTFPVKIRISFKRKSRYLPTAIIAKKTDISGDGHIRSWALQKVCAPVVDELRSIVSELSPMLLMDEDFDVEAVVRYIRKRWRNTAFRLDFKQWCRDYASSKTEGTASAYGSMISRLDEFQPGYLDVNDIDKDFVHRFVDWDTPHGIRALNDHIVRMKTCHNAAKLRYNDPDLETIPIPKSPFDGIELPKYMPEGAKAFTVDQMQRAISYRTKDPHRQLVIDLFVCSFALMGANLADIVDNYPPDKGTWVYRRKKTRGRRNDHAEMKVEVPECIRTRLSRRRLLNIAKRCVAGSYRGSMAAALKEMGLPVTTFYTARKTWATIARSPAVGADKAVVDECLAHVGDYRLTDIYAERNWEVINETNRKVLQLFEW